MTDIKEELSKVEAELKMIQERFLILTGAKQAFELILKSNGEENKTDGPDERNEKPAPPAA